MTAPAAILGHLAGAQRHGGLGFVDVPDADREGLGDLVVGAVGRGHVDADLRRLLVVERDAILQLELAVHHLEARVGDRVALAVALVRVGDLERADGGAGRVLVDLGAGQRHGGLRLVDVLHVDREGLADLVVAGIGRRHLEVDVGGQFIVERHAVLQLELAIDHLEAGVGNLVALHVARVRVGHIQAADHGALVVLGDLGRTQGHGGLLLVHVRDVDREGLRDLVARLVGRGHRHVDLGLDLVVDRRAALQLELAVDDLEAAVGNRIALLVAGIRVDHQHVADDRRPWSSRPRCSC